MENYNEGLIKACTILTEAWKDYFDDAEISENEFRPIDAFYNTLMDKFNKELMKRSVPIVGDSNRTIINKFANKR